MARKKYTAEQIINHLREAEILISQGKSVREGYRRITALLRNEGWHVNHKRVWRIWRDRTNKGRLDQMIGTGQGRTVFIGQENPPVR